MATISSGSPPEALVSTLAPAPQPMPAPPAGGGNIHILASLREHRRLAIAIAAFIAILGLPIAYLAGTPKYIATAVVYVSPRFISNLADSSTQKFDSIEQYREYLQQNVKTINRFDIVLESLQKVGGLESFWVRKGETLERAAARLQGALVIEEVADTYQISITLEGKKKTGLAELVNTIANTYIEKAKAEEFFDSDQRVRSLAADRARLQQEIADKQAQRMTLAQQLGVSSFSDSDENPYDRLLVTAKEAQSEAQKNAITAESQLAAFDEAQHPGGDEALHANALLEANKNPSLASLLTNLNVRRAQVLASLSGLSPDHPGRRAAERELADIDRQKQAATDEVVNSLAKSILDERSSEAYQARRVERQLASEVDRQASQAAWFTRGYQQGIQLGLDVDELRKADDSVQERIDYLTLERNAPGYVRLFSAARPPDQPVKGLRKILFAVFLALALLCAAAVPVGIDFFDPRLHSPRQVESVLGFPPVLWLMDAAEAGPAFEKEQILRLASRIAQDKRSHHSRIFVLTSVKARGGTSSIVLKTARALTSLGLPALAVEANAYRVDPRYTQTGALGLGGLSAVLTGNRHLHQEVVPGDGNLPDRIAAGEIGDSANLPEAQTLVQVLRQAAETYDIVLVDAPPALVSVDAEIVASSADVIILIVEAGAVTKEELRRAAKILERLKVPAFSALLNKVRRDEHTGIAEKSLNEFLPRSAVATPGLPGRWIWK